jgi:hypothetical protein
VQGSENLRKALQLVVEWRGALLRVRRGGEAAQSEEGEGWKFWHMSVICLLGVQDASRRCFSSGPKIL